MSWKEQLCKFSKISSISRFDLSVIIFIMTLGAFYLHDALYWGVGWVGETQYGDAEFWWNGALHVSQGIFQDNPGKGFRPGYFLLTGLTLPLLGDLFKQYFHYFLFAFLASSCLFYMALKQPLGRWAAACVVSMLVFNPFTAEWLATSTTDGTGLLLNILALSCLLFGVNNGLKRGWLIGFGVFFALATLTRPLMTPFIGLVAIVLMLIPHISYKKKIGIVACVLIAFCLPALMWMTVQKLTIDRWAISSNDASAFYAASDPKIQVWSPAMYDAIQLLAEQQYHVKQNTATDRMINQVFWQETIKNYLKYPGYHAKRLVPHVWQLAHFSPKRAVHGSDFWQILFLEIAAAGLALGLWFNRYKSRAVLLGILCAWIYFSPWIIPYLTMLGVVSALLSWKKGKIGSVFLGLYWLTGIMALYLVGGTWGTPSFSPLFDLNALGYRLGSQVFFVGDILAVYFIVYLASFKSSDSVSNWKVTRFLCEPSSRAAGIVVSFFTFCFVSISLVYLAGSIIVAKRAYARNVVAKESYPSLDPAKQAYKKRFNHLLVQGLINKGGLNNETYAIPAVKNEKADIVFTGAVSGFVWNLEGQPRAQLKVYTQSQVSPYTMGPGSIFLDIPEHVNAKDWVGKQGAFIIRQVADHHNTSNLPYYLTTAVLRAFVPLNEDKKNFDIAHTKWFAFVKNATQLESSKDLLFKDSKITWSLDSGQSNYQRRFFAMPQGKGKMPEKVNMILNVANTKGPSKLSFSYVMGDSTGATTKASMLEYYDVAVSTKKKKLSQPLLTSRESTPSVGNNAAIRNVELSIPSGTQAVEISFNHLTPGMGIWFYEFNLSAADFTSHAMSKKTAKKG